VVKRTVVPKVGCCGAACLCADQHFYPTSQTVRRIQHGGSAPCGIADSRATVRGPDRLNARVVLRESAAHDCTVGRHEKLLRLALVGFARSDLVVRYTAK
jgi:hypothetical protein